MLSKVDKKCNFKYEAQSTTSLIKTFLFINMIGIKIKYHDYQKLLT